MKIKETTIERVARYGIADIGKYRYLLDQKPAGRAIIKRHPIKSLGCVSWRRPYWEPVACYDGTAWHILD